MRINEQRIITTTLVKGISIVAAALLGGFVTGAFSFYRVTQSDHFLLGTVAATVEYLEQDHTTKNEVSLVKEANTQEHREIKEMLRETQADIKSLLRQR